jgi:hypothetical protein
MPTGHPRSTGSSVSERRAKCRARIQQCTGRESSHVFTEVFDKWRREAEKDGRADGE